MLASADFKASQEFIRRTLQHTLLLCAAAMTAWTLQASTAQASTTIGADLDWNMPIQINNVSSSAGFGIRLGQELHLPLIAVNPEIGFNYVTFSKDTPPKLYRFIAGGRLGIGELVRFGVLGHFGFAHATWKPTPDDYTHSGFTYDVGVFLEVTALPLLNIGIHGAYNRMAADDGQPDTLHWMQTGLHVTLVL